MFIRSERLFLRPGWPEDRDELLALAADKQVVRRLAGVPWPGPAEFVRDVLDVPEDRLLPRFLVTIPRGDGSSPGARVIGGCGLSIVRGDVHLAYWIAQRTWEQGHASEAVRAVLSLARALGHQRIVACHPSEDAASGYMLEEAGFVRTGAVVETIGTGDGSKGDGGKGDGRTGGGGCVPVQEYEVVFEAPMDRGDDDSLGGLTGGSLSRRRAA